MYFPNVCREILGRLLLLNKKGRFDILKAREPVSHICTRCELYDTISVTCEGGSAI